MITLQLPDELVEVIAAKVTQRVLDTLADERSPWLTRKQAAEYLHVPLSRLEKDRTVPSHHWNGRVLYHREELDAYLLGLGRNQ